MSRPAAAQSPVSAAQAEAEQRFRRGIELYKEGDFAQALIELKRAYSLAPNYKVLFNIGQVQFELGEYAGALRTFEKYLAEGGAEVPEEKQVSVKADLQKLRLRVGRIEIVTPTEGAEVSIDDVPVGKTPLAEQLLVTAGRRRVTLSHAGRTLNRVVEVAGGEVAKVELSLGEPAPAPTPTTTVTSTAPPTSTPPEAPPQGGSSLVWLPWVLTGLCAVGTGVTGGLTLSASNDLAQKRETLTTRDDLDKAAGDVKTLAAVTDVLGVASIVGLAVSIGVTVSSGKKDAPKAALLWPGSPPVGPRATPPGVQVRLSGAPGGAILSGAF
ncbi:MAG: PEGA domain-containing protein [Polyangiaceae bacterium]